MRVLLYGGSFDPPHYGHMNNLRAAAARVRPDRVVVMPAGVSPFKQGPTASGPLRVEMCGCFAALARELGFGAGMGLPNMKRYSDEMTIDTEVGKGTTVTVKIKVS